MILGWQSPAMGQDQLELNGMGFWVAGWHATTFRQQASTALQPLQGAHHRFLVTALLSPVRSAHRRVAGQPRVDDWRAGAMARAGLGFRLFVGPAPGARGCAVLPAGPRPVTGATRLGKRFD
jgi:hypothetical protein